MPDCDEVVAAVKEVLQQAPPEFWQDRQAALQQNGYALEHASAEVQNREVVKVAVQQDGRAGRRWGRQDGEEEPAAAIRDIDVRRLQADVEAAVNEDKVQTTRAGPKASDQQERQCKEMAHADKPTAAIYPSPEQPSMRKLAEAETEETETATAVAAGVNRFRGRFLLACVLAAWLPGAVADDPCARPCGRENTCADFNRSFTCKDLSLLNCDCTGCCLAALAPLAPPAPPPPVLPPPGAPKPLLPPVPPGEAAVGTMDEIRAAIEERRMRPPGNPPFPTPPPAAPPGLPPPPSAPPTPLAPPPSDPLPPPSPELPPAPPLPPPPPLLPLPPLAPLIASEVGSLVLHLSGLYPLGGSPLVVSGVDVTLEGGAEGATLDAEEMSRAIEITDGGKLLLRRVHVVNGRATHAGGVLVEGVGSALVMEGASVRDSVATDPIGDNPEDDDTLREGVGGGLTVRFGASAVLVESTIADCATRDSWGGGAYVEQANLTLQGGSRVERCLAKEGGGLYAWEGDVVLLEGSVFSECHAIYAAGGLRARLVAHVERALPTHTGAGACLFFLLNSLGRMMESAIVNCTANAGAGGLAASGQECSFLATDSVFEDCRAAAYFGGAWLAQGAEYKFVDCHFLRCHAGTNSGGGLTSQFGASIEMIRGSIMGCSAAQGGGVLIYGLATLRLLDVTIAECRATRVDGDGGGIYVNSDFNVLNMSGGVIRDCEAPDSGGGLLVLATVQAHLHGVTVQRCKADYGGGMSLEGIVALIDIGIEDCSATQQSSAMMQWSGSLRAERVRVERAIGWRPTTLYGTSIWTDSTFVDCSRGPEVGSGAHSFTRLSIRGATEYGLTTGVGDLLSGVAVAVVIDSHIADGQGTCVGAGDKGTLILRNVTLSNYSSPATPCVSLKTAAAAASFQAEVLTLEPGCEAEHGGALISVGDAASTAPLNVRGLRVVAPAACASADLTIFDDHARPRNCSDAEDVCGAAATCTDVQPLPSAAPNLTTIDCSCTLPYFSNPFGTSEALAPYGFKLSSIGLPEGVDASDIGLPGSTIDYCVCCSTSNHSVHAYHSSRCFATRCAAQVTPREASKATLRGFIQETVLRLAKTNESSVAHTLELVIDMKGTDVAPAAWTIEAASVPSWLSLPLAGGIGPRDATQPLSDLSPFGNLSLTATTSGLYERLATPYEASLNLSVTSQRDVSFLVNVILFVSAPTIARTSVWGRPTEDRVCSPSDDEPIVAVVGEPSGVPFTACDVDGLAVDHEDAGGFEAVLVDRSSGASHSVSVAYDLPGTYVVDISAPHLGEFGLRLRFTAADGTTEPVGAERAVRAVCPTTKAPLPDGLGCGCERGTTFNEDRGECAPCPPGTSSEAGASNCGVCAPGFFLLDLTAQPNQDQCKPCIDGAECGWNATLRTIKMQPNHWRLSELTTDVQRCEGSADASVCLGGSSIGACVEGQGGPRCMVCATKDHYYDKTDGFCAKCPAAGGAMAKVVGILAAVGAVLLFVRLLFLYPERIPPPLRSVANVILWFFRRLLTLGLQAKLKIFLAFYQVTTVFNSIYSVRLPPYYTDWMRHFDFLNLQWDDLFGFPAGCVAQSFKEKLLLTALAPLALIAAMFVLLTGRSAAFSRAAAADAGLGSLCAALSDGLLASAPFALVVIFAFVPSVSATIFKAWSCQGFGDTPSTSRYYLREDLSIECDKSAAHTEVEEVAIVLLILWPIGALVICAVLLLAARRSILDRTPNRLVRATAFLHRDYHPECFYWELIELARRTFLTGWVLLFDESRSFVRILVGLMISVAIFTLTVIRRPYLHYEDHYLAISAQFLVVISFIGAITVKAYEDVDARAEQRGVYGEAAAVFGFDSSHQLVDMLLSFSILMIFPFLFGTVAYNVLQEGRVLKVLLRGTDKPPELTLKEGQRYHLFNSHIWSTGQDVAATIKRQLQRLFPSLRCFLDGPPPPSLEPGICSLCYGSVAPSPLAIPMAVDDLEDISKLEEYVIPSAAMLLLLSKGYLRSRNCLREVVATLDKSIPYLFVHEADESKGGAPLAALQLELQDEELRKKLFDGRRVTQWHRVSHFQMISLLQIAEDMLKVSPSYQGVDGFEIYMPGAVHEQQLAFTTPVLLYTSPNNPGAADAAAEMQATYEENLHVSSVMPKMVKARSTLARLPTLRSLPVGGVLSSLKGEQHASSTLMPGGAEPRAEQMPAGGPSVELVATSSTKTDTSTPAPQSPTGQAPTKPTHFLLYLSNKTFVGSQGEALAREVSKARAAGLPVVLVHENDGARDGCAFDTFFQTTPKDLINGDLYHRLAVPFVSGDAHRKLSRALLAKELGAQEKKSRALYRLTSTAARSSRDYPSATVAQEQNV